MAEGPSQWSALFYQPPLRLRRTDYFNVLKVPVPSKISFATRTSNSLQPPRRQLPSKTPPEVDNMGGTDLNLKKSWHPKILANQRRVHDAEVSALEERKKTEARLQEIKAERAQEEIQRQLEAAGGKKRIDRVDWMYQGPTDGQVGDAYGNEAYLLGKRRIDNIIRGDETKNLQKQPGPDGLAPVQNVLSTRDTATKIREDPLLAIKKQEQSAYEALLNDPIKRRQLLASMGIADDQSKSKSKEERRHKHRHHHRRRHHDDDSDYERRHKRRRSDSRDRSRSRRRYDSEDEDRERKRRRSSTERRRVDSEDGERGSYDRRDQVDERRDSRRDRSRSPRRERDISIEDTRDRRRDREDDRRRPPPYESDPSEEEAPPRRRDDHRDSRDNRRVNYRQGPRDGQNGDSRRRYNGNGNRNGNGHPYSNGPRNGSDNKNDDEERARKLAAMQDAASSLDEARESRLAALAAKDKAEREADDRAREKASKYGDDRAFAKNLHRSVGEKSLADRVGRGRQNLQRDDD